MTKPLRAQQTSKWGRDSEHDRHSSTSSTSGLLSTLDEAFDNLLPTRTGISRSTESQASFQGSNDHSKKAKLQSPAEKSKIDARLQWSPNLSSPLRPPRHDRSIKKGPPKRSQQKQVKQSKDQVTSSKGDESGSDYDDIEGRHSKPHQMWEILSTKNEESTFGLSSPALLKITEPSEPALRIKNGKVRDNFEKRRHLESSPFHQMASENGSHDEHMESYFREQNDASQARNTDNRRLPGSGVKRMSIIDDTDRAEEDEHMEMFGEHMNPGMTGKIEGIEPAWADDASCIDVNEEMLARKAMPEKAHQSLPATENEGPPRSGTMSPAEIEMAALRRQVEQLQMALKQRSDTEEGGGHEDDGKHESIKRYRNRLHVSGIPTPDDSTVGSRQKSTRSAGSGSGRQNLRMDDFDRPYKRNQVPFYSHDGIYPRSSPVPSSTSRRDRSRLHSDAGSSLVDHSMLAFSPNHGTGESARFEEMAKKVEALELLFRAAALAPHQAPAVAAFSQNFSTLRPPQDINEFAGRPSNLTYRPSMQTDRHFLSTDEHEQEYRRPSHDYVDSSPHQQSDKPLDRRYLGRTPSLSSLSETTQEMSARTRSPATSVFQYNTTPYGKDMNVPGQRGARKNSTRSSSTENSTVDASKSTASFGALGAHRKGVARFVLGSSRDTMQVSWSRKRTERVEKPKTKIKGGPGRGRVVVVPKENAAR